MICFALVAKTLESEPYQYLVHLFSMRTGQLSRSYLLTLSSKVFLCCPCMDEADGSIWSIGQLLEDFEGSDLLYKIVFDENSSTAQCTCADRLLLPR